MERICENELCTGCAACANICPKDAITLQEDGVLGYMYPVIDTSRCIDCGLCEKICPVNHPLDLHEPLSTYAAISQDFEDLMTSTSGGASSVLVQTILTMGGVVYGCVQEDYKNIMHCRIDKIENAGLLKNSKYVQSNISLIFRTVKKDLQEGQTVLFTGTPCQIAGLRNYLKKDYDNLYLVDLVCHGVPSQKLLQDNVEYILKKNDVRDGKYKVLFREKGLQISNGNLRFGIFLTGDNVPKLPEKDLLFPYNDYITAFMSGIIFRDNCFICPYAKSQRVSDITIADFWGLNPCTVPSENGVSLLLVMTDKGQHLIEFARNKFKMEKRPVKEAIMGNGQLQQPSKYVPDKVIFTQRYQMNKEKAYTECLYSYRKTLYRKKRYEHILKRIPYVYKIRQIIKNIQR